MCHPTAGGQAAPLFSRGTARLTALARGGWAVPLLSRGGGSKASISCSEGGRGGRVQMGATANCWGMEAVRLQNRKEKEGDLQETLLSVSWIYVSYDKVLTEDLKHRNPRLGN